MDWSLLWLAGLGLFLAGVVKGATGLGYSSCALPFLVSALGLKPAMALVLDTGHGHQRDRRIYGWPLCRDVAAFCKPLRGDVAGDRGRRLPADVDRPGFGREDVGSRRHRLRGDDLGSSSGADIEVCREGPSSPDGFANGVLTGLTGSQVMPLFPYMMSLDLDPSRLVQAINLAVTVASVFLAIGLIYAGIMTPELMGVSILAIVPAIVGTQLGTQLRSHIPASQFRSVVLYVLLATGFLLLVRA